MGRQYSLEQSIPFLLHRISTVFAQTMLEDLRPAGVNVNRWRVLSSLKSRGESTIGELSAFIGARQPVISRIISEMQEDGLVERKQSNKDQRVTRLRLTRSGNSLFNRLYPSIQRRREKALEGLSQLERSQLIKILRVIEKNLDIY